MDEYDTIIKSSLKFKGEKKKKKRKTDRGTSDNSCTAPLPPPLDERLEDAENHGGWWRVNRFEQIRGDIAIEFLPGCYAKALANGRIVLGYPHPPGEGPDEEEIFTSITTSTNKLALKSGFGRYVTVNNKRRLMGLAEAIGELESFSPIFEESKLALCAHNDCFISPEDNSDSQCLIVAQSETAGPNEHCTIRINHDPIKFIAKESQSSGATRLRGDELLKQTLKNELSHMKNASAKHALDYLSLDEEKKRIKRARQEGQLHEALLETRAKIKSDKYCK